MRIIEVQDARSRREFLDVASFIYRNDPVFVRPLDAEIEAVFDPKTNSYHSHGVITRWLLKDGQDKPIGRVAAFINEKKAWLPDQPTGGMGFFECIDDPEAAGLLFDTCRQWLASRGMKAMDGPKIGRASCRERGRVGGAVGAGRNATDGQKGGHASG